MRDLPAAPQQFREYVIQHFLGRGSLGRSVWARVTGAVVAFSDQGAPGRIGPRGM